MFSGFVDERVQLAKRAMAGGGLSSARERPSPVTGGTGFFFAQPDKPEQAILADPLAWYDARDAGVRERMGDEAYDT